MTATEALRKLRTAMRAVIDEQGIAHDHEDDACPEDDTCECHIISLVNDALAAADVVLGER